MMFSKPRRGRQLSLEEMAVQARIITGYGDIAIDFLPHVAPNHVSNFINLARQKFYDGLQFHRVIKDFMIQTGCPFTRGPDKSRYGLGDAGYTIPEEFSAKHHDAGTVAMARGKDINSASSQFFICLRLDESLLGRYTVFGQVAEGMDAVQRIGAVPTDDRNIPKVPVVVKKIQIVE